MWLNFLGTIAFGGISILIVSSVQEAASELVHVVMQESYLDQTVKKNKQ